MPISSTTRFKSVGANIWFGGIDFGCVTDETPSVGYGWKFTASGMSGSTTEKEANLLALQTLYASADGIRRADGTPTPIIKSGQVATGSFEDLVDEGLFNPLVEGDFEAWQNRHQAAMTLGREIVISKDATSGRPDFASTVGIKPADRVPTSGIFNQYLSDWHLEQVSSTRYKFMLNANDVVASDILGTPRVEAMFRYLVGKKTSGASINISSVTTQLELHSALSGREFTIEQSTGSNVILSLYSTSSGAGSGIMGMAIIFDLVTNSATPNINTINALLDSSFITLTGVSGPAEKVPFGSELTHLTALRHGFNEGAYIEREGDWLTYRGKDLPNEAEPTNRPIHHTLLGAAYGRIINIEDLEVDSAGKRLLPNRWNVIGLYNSGNTNETIKIARPQSLIPHAGNAWKLWIHNDTDIGNTTKITIEDFTGLNITTLIQGERVFLSLVHRTDGSGEITTTTPFERRLSIHGDVDTVFNLNGTFTNAPVETPAHNGLVIPRARTSQEDVSYHNEEAFEIASSGAYTSGADFVTADLRTANQTFKVLKEGWLRAELSVGINSANSGYIGSGHGIRLYSQAETTPFAKEELRSDIQRSFGTYTSRDYALITEKQIYTNGLILIPVYTYHTAISMPLGDMRLSTYELDLILTQTIQLTYA